MAPTETQPIVVDDHEEWEVEEILGHRYFRNQTQYLVKWLGWPSYENLWEPVENLENAQETLQAYRAANRLLDKPRRRRGRKS